MFARGLRDRFQVDDLEKRIARRFDPDHSRVLLDRRFEARRIRQIDISKIEIRGATPNFFEKTKCAAVKIVADDDVRSAFEQIERGRHGRQTRRECKAARAAFQIGDAFFVGEPGRINRARIIVAFVLAGTFLDVGRCCVNRRHDRARRRIRLLAGVNRAGRELVLSLHVDLFECAR